MSCDCNANILEIIPGSTAIFGVVFDVPAETIEDFDVHFYHQDETKVYSFSEEDTGNIMRTEEDPNMVYIVLPPEKTLEFVNGETAKMQVEYTIGGYHDIRRDVPVPIGRNLERGESE